eukprot:UC1_evm2s1173
MKIPGMGLFDVSMALVAFETGGWEETPTGGPAYKVPRGKHTKWESRARQDEVVRRVESRIARVTGVPIHDREDMVTLARMTTLGREPHGGQFVPWGLHHETDTRPYRTRTVLVYLTDVEAGGHTIFPLCGGSHPAAPDSPEQELNTSMIEALGGIWGGRRSGFQRHVDFDVRSDHPFNTVFAQSCLGLYGVSFKPRRGAAILFDSKLYPSTKDNTMTWHGGCNVVSGTKVILQKFKELPWEQR